MANPIAVPTKNPGELYIPALGKTFQQVELREDDVFDTVEIYGTALGAGGAIPAGTELLMFNNITNKNEQHTNMPSQASRIQSGDEVAVFRVGIHPREAIGNALPLFNDYRKVVGNCQLELKFNRRLITTGPIVKYPSGYGMSGYSDESSATAATIGLASIAAAPTLFVPQQLTDKDDIKAKLRFPNASWFTGYAVPSLNANLAVSCFLHGVMKAPLGM